MSKLISTLNNIELETQDKINLISNMQIHSKYENAEYDQFIEKIVNNTNDIKSIDIYSLILCLNSEICLNLAQINKIPEIIESYFSVLESKFSNISPSDSKQKSELAEKGINKFLNIIDSNFAEIKNLEIISSSIIDNIIELTNKLLTFFDENNLSYDSDLKAQLARTLNKIKKSLALEEQKIQDTVQEPVEETKEGTTTNTKLPKSATISHGSEKWQSLVEKIEVLKNLVDNERIFETSIVYDDIQNLLANFDPKEYFPEVFFPLYKKIAPVISDIHKNIDYYSTSIQWSIAKKMYEIDYNQFLDNLERMPENNFLNSTSSSLAQEYFYQTNSEVKKQYRENNKILEDNDAHKPNISIKSQNRKDGSPQNIIKQEDNIENISNDELDKLFDF
ncbi:type VI secretion system protein IglI family protein [Francisella philomiragia]|uniref:Phage tail protein n=1 Tax=Francisella philomiragia TaxID=28110 RepID=A0ABS1G914_9GAMM|nr:type VI secretion system protein IglI family protein [Francisella philomiragia]MBK2257614.1 phage tail protein [Francisella philomiragia]MBK2301302.1 phage tail protein [Francisella philomiragia]